MDVYYQLKTSTYTNSPQFCLKVLLFSGDAPEGSKASSSELSVVVPLSDVPPDMVPISTAIEDVEAGEEATIVVNSGSGSSPSKAPPAKSPAAFDKSKLFSQMEDTFAKDTNPALKNRPIYRRRTNNSASAASDSVEGCSSLIWSPPKSPSKASSSSAGACGVTCAFFLKMRQSDCTAATTLVCSLLPNLEKCYVKHDNARITVQIIPRCG